MVSLKGTRYGTTITVENYSLYQDKGTTKGTTKGTVKGIVQGIPEGTQKNKYKEIKKEKGKVIKSEIVDGFLIETDEFGREYAEKVEVN